MKKHLNRNVYLILALLVLLGSFYKTIGLQVNKNLFLDEASVWYYSRSPTIEILKGNYDHFRFHPPLFYLVTHFWMKISSSESWLRLLSIVPNLLSIPLLFLLARKLGNNKLALITTFIYTTSAYHHYYSMQLRVYELLFFFSLMYIFFFIQALRSNTLKHWLVAGVVGALSFNIDYSFIWIYLSSNIYYMLVYRRNLYDWLIGNFPSFFVIIYYAVRLLPTATETSSSLQWIGTPDVNTIISLLISFIRSNRQNWESNLPNELKSIYEISSLIIFIALLKSISYKFKNKSFIIIITFLPIIASFLISQTYPVFIDYNLIITSFGLFFLLARVAYYSNRKTSLLVLSTWIFINLLSFRNFLILPPTEDWSSAIKFMKNYLNSSGKVLIFPAFFSKSLKYYNQRYQLIPTKNIFLAESPKDASEFLNKMKRDKINSCAVLRNYDVDRSAENERRELENVNIDQFKKLSGIQIYCINSTN